MLSPGGDLGLVQIADAGLVLRGGGRDDDDREQQYECGGGDASFSSDNDSLANKHLAELLTLAIQGRGAFRAADNATAPTPDDAPLVSGSRPETPG